MVRSLRNCRQEKFWISLISNTVHPVLLLGSYSKDGVEAIVSQGPAWWWCDHYQGITERKGERFEDGRPKVPDKYLDVLQGMTLEEV